MAKAKLSGELKSDELGVLGEDVKKKDSNQAFTLVASDGHQEIPVENHYQQYELPVFDSETLNKISASEQRNFLILTKKLTVTTVEEQIIKYYNDLLVGMYIAFDNISSLNVEQLKALYIITQDALARIIRQLGCKPDYKRRFIKDNKNVKERKLCLNGNNYELNEVQKVVQLLMKYLAIITEKDTKPVLEQVLQILEEGLCKTMNRARTNKLKTVDQIIKVMGKKESNTTVSNLDILKQMVNCPIYNWNTTSLVHEIETQMEKEKMVKQQNQIKMERKSTHEWTDSEFKNNEFTKKGQVEQERGQFLQQQPSNIYQTTFYQCQIKKQILSTILETTTLNTINSGYKKLPNENEVYEIMKCNWTEKDLIELKPIEREVAQIITMYTQVGDTVKETKYRETREVIKLVTEDNGDNCM